MIDPAQEMAAEASRTSVLSEQVLPGSTAEFLTHGGIRYGVWGKKGNTF